MTFSEMLDLSIIKLLCITNYRKSIGNKLLPKPDWHGPERDYCKFQQE